MANVEKISIALPAEMLGKVREAVDAGDYASSSEVVRDALRDWSDKRKRRDEALSHLRKLAQQAISDPRPSLPIEEVMGRLLRKFDGTNVPAEAPEDFPAGG